MTRFRVYYGDGTTFDGSAPEAVERVTDVQAVVYEDPDTGFTNEVSPEGYWLWRDGQWYGSDTMGFWQYLMTPGVPKWVLFGRSMTKAQWDALRARVREDGGFPPKSGQHKREAPNRG